MLGRHDRQALERMWRFPGSWWAWPRCGRPGRSGLGCRTCPIGCPAVALPSERAVRYRPRARTFPWKSVAQCRSPDVHRLRHAGIFARAHVTCPARLARFDRTGSARTRADLPSRRRPSGTGAQPEAVTAARTEAWRSPATVATTGAWCAAPLCVARAARLSSRRLSLSHRRRICLCRIL